MTTIEDTRQMTGEAKDLAAQGEQEQAIDLLAEGLEAAVDELVSLNTQVAKLQSQSEEFITSAHTTPFLIPRMRFFELTSHGLPPVRQILVGGCTNR